MSIKHKKPLEITDRQSYFPIYIISMDLSVAATDGIKISDWLLAIGSSPITRNIKHY